MHAVVALLAVTPTPTPTAPPDDLVTPGPWGFTAIAILGVAVIVLVWDMLRRIRRVRYREEAGEVLDAEEAQRQADEAVLDTDVDDQSIDAGDDPPRL